MTTMSLPIATSASSATATACGTYVDAGSKGGAVTHGQVGACHRTDCVHNSALECTAHDVEVGPGADVADCLTYTPA